MPHLAGGLLATGQRHQHLVQERSHVVEREPADRVLQLDEASLQMHQD